MAWTNPKTDWSAAYNPGPGDFNRIEKNTQYLKEYCLFWYEPSDELLIESASEKMVKSESRGVMKSFHLQYPGKYKITFQARRAATSSIYWELNHAYVYVAGNSTGTLTTDWKTFTFTFQVDANTTHNIEGHGRQQYPFGSEPEALAVYIRNVQIFASPVRLVAVPASFILE